MVTCSLRHSCGGSHVKALNPQPESPKPNTLDHQSLTLNPKPKVVVQSLDDPATRFVLQALHA